MKHIAFPRSTGRSLGVFHGVVFRLCSLACAVTLCLVPLTANANTSSNKAGKISWYGEEFHGKRTASGRTYDQNDFTAAHPNLPFGTVLRVYSLNNNSHVLVEVTDRGPFGGNRLVDVSKRAAKSLGLMALGVGRAAIEVVSKPDGTPIDQENAFYLRLTPALPEAKAQKQLQALQTKMQGKPLKIMHSTSSAKNNAIVALGPFKSFKQARKARGTGKTLLSEATIIEASKDGNTFMLRSPKKPAKTKKAKTTVALAKKQTSASGVKATNQRRVTVSPVK
ncbi:septal ring lytic transglycosylase RlpA family protein [Desulfovibrio cuneatus]|uniref:septal ring lytic transglycosylase RlpA family protein n=1 Tax=Desulfovibrio cuneatus TaxID=159728 RepID=UPI0003FDB476|nr:septal ring lytic transglycosylase RlpA family protein [Desulfovibrio cuneatus]